MRNLISHHMLTLRPKRKIAHARIWIQVQVRLPWLHTWDVNVCLRYLWLQRQSVFACRTSKNLRRQSGPSLKQSTTENRWFFPTITCTRYNASDRRQLNSRYKVYRPWNACFHDIAYSTNFIVIAMVRQTWRSTTDWRQKHSKRFEIRRIQNLPTHTRAMKQ